MKKLLALVLCAAMIASMCVFSTSAAADYAIMPGDKVLTGEGNFPLKPDKSYNVEDMTLEFDAAFIADNEKGVCGFGIDSSNGTRLTISRFGIGFVNTYDDADTIKGAVTPFGEVEPASWENQHHFKLVNTGSGVTIYVDGEQKFTSSDKVALWAGVVNLGFHAGTMAVKNLSMTTNGGDEILTWNGSDLMGGQLGGGGGWGGVQEIIEAPDFLPPSADYLIMPGEKVIFIEGNCPLMPSGGYDINDVAVEFDVAFVADNDKNVCGLGIETTSKRLTISRYGVGIVDTYDTAANIIAASTPLPNVEAASWTNQHHVKVTNTSAGISVEIDGAVIFTSTEKLVQWAGVLNLGGHAGALAFDNIVMTTASNGNVLLSSDGTTLLDGQIGAGGGYGGVHTLGEAPDFIVKNPTVNVLTGYTQLSYNGDLADKQVYTMDLALIPDENGVAELTVWGGSDGTMDRAGIKLNANTGKATVGVACDNTGKAGHEGHGDFTAPVEFNWGAGTYANMHKVVFTFDGTVTINIDGEDVYNSGLTVGTNGNSFAVLMAANGVCPIDNFSLVSGDVNLASDFEKGSPEIGGGSVTTIYPCGDKHSFSKFYATTTHPTCTDKGVGTAICEICGEATTTREIAALGHNFTDNWDNADNVTADKREYNCRRCGMTVSTSLPAEGTYTGSYSMYNDFNDKLMSEKVAEFNFEGKGYMSADGKFSANTTDRPCWQPGFSDKLNSNVGYTHSIDVRLNKLLDGASSNQYGHKFQFWFGGQTGLVIYAGVDFDNNEAYITPVDGGSFEESRTSVNIGLGEWHNYALKYLADWNDETCILEFQIDGVAVCRVDGDTSEDLIYIAGRPEGETDDLQCIWMYDLDVSFDNYVIGSFDFAWTNGATLLGDVNGDGKVNMLDLLRAKKYVAELVGADQVDLVNGDLDSKRDGITVADILLLKRLISTL